MVGDGPPTQIGTGPKIVSGPDEIRLGYNDDFYPDNGGGFTVTIRTCTVSLSALGVRLCLFL